jgi:hypothetical protein
MDEDRGRSDEEAEEPEAEADEEPEGELSDDDLEEASGGGIYGPPPGWGQEPV